MEDVVFEANVKTVKVIETLKEIREKIKELAEQEKLLIDNIKEMMGDRTVMIHDGEILATWKESKPTRVLDVKALKEEQPEIYKEYEVEKEGTKRFLIK